MSRATGRSRAVGVVRPDLAEGLSEVEARRRLLEFGPNELPAVRKQSVWGAVAAQFTHPLALLLWAAAVLAFVSGTPVLGTAIVAVVFLNAAFSFVQEAQAEHAVESLKHYLPATSRVLRDGVACAIPARTLVPGDVLLIAEGERISADGDLVEGAIDVDTSTLTGESMPVSRAADDLDARSVRSGTMCLDGTARAVVTATGASTELGRVAALTGRVAHGSSPLEHQVKRVAWLIAAVAVGVGILFLPLGLLAGLSLPEAGIFAIGLLVANVPEGLLPTITLALATGVRALARRGALVKRLSAVETLGSTSVICTDKTGTLTQNRMTVVRAWTFDGSVELAAAATAVPPSVRALLAVAARCTTAEVRANGSFDGDPTEVALLQAAKRTGSDTERSGSPRLAVHRFDPRLRRMSTVDALADGLRVSCKGAPESVLPLCVALDEGAVRRTLDEATRTEIAAQVEAMAASGLRVLAIAAKPITEGVDDRSATESDLDLLGLVGLLDPPRVDVREAVLMCHAAGIVVHVVTGDNGRTAAEVARKVGIGTDGVRVVSGDELDAMPEGALRALLGERVETIFARSSPQAKLRITDALHDIGEVVAMTGDGVNDAPALRAADIGVAMGLSGTDVAREAATMVLTDDDFGTVVEAVRTGRQVYDNVRKFLVYIFAHAVPEIVPFLVFALSGGAVPLPLTVLQILAIDLGTETLPALALGREPAEPGLMERPPRKRGENVVRRAMLVRAWGVLGVTSAVLVMGAFFVVLSRGGWEFGDDTSIGSPSHELYLRATTMTFVALVACQVGTAFASRTERASLRQVGVFTNRLLLGGIAFELMFTAALVYLPPLQHLFRTAPLTPVDLLIVLPFPFIVWGVDELWRLRIRRRDPVPNPAGHEVPPRTPPPALGSITPRDEPGSTTR